jgi:DNA polymerase III delta subunit
MPEGAKTVITALIGNNSFALQKRLKELVNSFVKEYGELALERIDAEEADVQAILDALQNLPFLVSKKMVVVRGLAQNKQASEKIEQIIGAAGEDTELILYEPVIDKRTAYFKTLKSKTLAEEFNELDARALTKWLGEEAKKREGEITHADAAYLVERAGVDQALLSNELDKLITYDPKIKREAIDLLTDPLPQSKVFDLLDAAFSGNKSRALKLYEEQRALKVEPQAILAMIAWQLQLLALTKYADGKSAAQIAKDVGMNPYPVSKAANLAHKLDEEKFNKMIDFAFEIDLKSKTTPLDLDEALKTYIITL